MQFKLPNPWKGLRALPRDMWFLFFATLINRAGTMALPFLVLYLTRSIHLSAAQAGLAISVYGVGALVTAPISGWLCDRFNPLRIMEISLLTTGGFLFFFPFLSTYESILAVTFLWAMASEAFRPANLTFVTDAVPPEQRKLAFAFFRLAINLGMSIGPAIGGFLAVLSYSALFFVNATTTLVAGLLLVLSPIRTHHRHLAAPTGDKGTETGSALRGYPASNLRLFWFLAALLPTLAIFFQHEAALPIFMVRDLHLNEAIYGLMFTINTGLIIFLEIPLNLAMEEWPYKRTLPFGALLFGLGFGLLAFAQDAWFIAMTVVVWTFGEMILFPSTASFLGEIAPSQLRGRYMGFYQMMVSLAFAVGPWLGTFVLDLFGSTALWMGCLVAGLLSGGLLLKATVLPKATTTS